MTGPETKTLSISLIQSETVWEDITANLDNIEHLLRKHSTFSDLYILPETFSTGFTMQPEKFSEKESERAVQWMKEQAQKLNAMFIGGVICREGKMYFNRLYWITSSGTEGHYDKRHLFRMGREQEHYKAGSERKIISYRGFRILPLICYDLRFPVFSRNRNDYDILLYIANWPASRQHVWNILLQARAIENQSYVLGVNRTGIDGEGMKHSGETSIIDPLGQKRAGLKDKPGILHYEIHLNEITDFRRKFPVLKDADNFAINFD